MYKRQLLTLGLLFHHPIAVTIYIIITGSLRAITGGYHCKKEITEQKQVSALVYIDNYDEALDKMCIRDRSGAWPYSGDSYTCHIQYEDGRCTV